MSSRVVKEMLDNFEVESMNLFEVLTYRKYLNDGLPKRTALLKLMFKNKQLSYYLQELKEVINEYEKN